MYSKMIAYDVCILEASYIMPSIAILARHFREHSCEVILNLHEWFRRSCRLKKGLRTGDARGTRTDHNS